MSRNTPAQIHLADEQAEALRLRAAGATYRQISAEQGVHESTAKRRVDAALAATVQEPADELRTLEAHRLDGLFVIAARQASSGGRGAMGAIDRCLTIMERRARLLGLDAPLRIEEHVFTEDAVDVAIRELEARLAENDPEAVEDRGAAAQDRTADRASGAAG